MAKQKNNKKQQAHRQSVLSGVKMELHPEGNLKDTALITVRDILIGVVAGGAAGAAIGRSSLLVGAGVAGVGHYKKVPLVTLFGIGMMAANGFQTANNTVKGVDQDVMDGIKDRLMAYKESFQEKLYLDKILKKVAPVNGIGNVQYFTYPANQAGQGTTKELDMNALDKIEAHIRQSAEDFANKKQANGLEGNEWMETANY